MDGTVKIALEDYERLRDSLTVRERQMGSLLQQTKIFKGELTAFLTFLARKYPLGDSIKEFNKQATHSQILYDSKNLTVDIELHTNIDSEED